MGNPVILGISSDQISVFIYKGSYDLRSSPSSEGFWHRRDILLEPRTITQSDFLTWSSYHRGTLGEISRVFHMSILGSINSVDLRTVPKQCTTWLHLSQHRVCRIKTFLLPEKIKKRWRPLPLLCLIPSEKMFFSANRRWSVKVRIMSRWFSLRFVHYTLQGCHKML